MPTEDDMDQPADRTLGEAVRDLKFWKSLGGILLILGVFVLLMPWGLVLVAFCGRYFNWVLHLCGVGIGVYD